MEPRLSEHISEKMHDIIQRFVSRTARFKERAVQPPTPSTGEQTSGQLKSLSTVNRRSCYAQTRFYCICLFSVTVSPIHSGCVYYTL